jgi:hypothetical protein
MQIFQIFSQAAPDLLNREFWLYYISNLIDPRMAKQAFLPASQQQLNAMLAALAQQVAQGELPAAMKALITSGAGGGPTEQSAAPGVL